MRKVWWILFLSSAQAQGAELASWVRESPGYAALRAQRAEAALALEAARAGLLPTLAPQVDYAKTSLSENLSLGLGGSLAVLPWSDAQDALAAAARALKQADLELKAEGNALFLEALGRYLEAWLAELDLALAEKRVALNEAQLAAAKAQEAQGQATFKDVLEAESALAEAKASLFAAQNARALASARLERILGRAVAPKALPLPQDPPSLEEALAALENRPDVALARLRLEEAEAALAQASRDRALPQGSFSLSLAQGGLDLSLSLDLGAGALGYALGYTALGAAEGTSLRAGASLPLFAPVQEANQKVLENRVAQAKLALEAALKDGEPDLRQKHQARLLAEAQLAAAETSLKAAEASLETAKKRLQAGTGTRLEVLQAEVGLLQAQRTLEQAKANLLQAHYALMDAMGIDLLGGER